MRCQPLSPGDVGLVWTTPGSAQEIRTADQESSTPINCCWSGVRVQCDGKFDNRPRLNGLSSGTLIRALCGKFHLIHFGL